MNLNKIFSKYLVNEDSIQLLDKNQNKQFYCQKSFSICCYFISLFIIIPIILYLLIILTPISNNHLFIPEAMFKSSNILLVVAHPDDECLFFSPAITGLISLRKKVHLLVFSTGNSNGLGPKREFELKGSCIILGIDLSHCIVLNLTDLQDNPKGWWPKEKISSIVEFYLKKFSIDLIITFDSYGISGHLNHRSVSNGIKYLINNNERLLGYQLETVSVLFKFTSILNIFPTIIRYLFRLFCSSTGEHVLFVSSPHEYLKGLKAFHSHRSQMVWYRYLYTTFSRYMFINDLKMIPSE